MSALQPHCGREDASSTHKFAVIQLHGDSCPLDPAHVVGENPSVDKSSQSYRVSKQSAISVHTFGGALARKELLKAGFLIYFILDFYGH